MGTKKTAEKKTRKPKAETAVPTRSKKDKPAKIAGRISLAFKGDASIEADVRGLAISKHHVCWHHNGKTWEIFYADEQRALAKAPASSPIDEATGQRRDGIQFFQTGSHNMRETIKRMTNRNPSQIGISLPKAAGEDTEPAAADGEAPKADRKQRPPKAPGKMSLVDAAVQVLLDEGRSMKPAEMVDLAAGKGLWTPGAGKTPAATLSAAIGREIATKGDASRFRKVAPGTFDAARL